MLGIPGLRVRIGSCLSETCDVISDVPPGTPLGTVLFLLFIKDLEELFYSNITVKLFADDVKIYIVINDIVDVNMSQKGLDSLADWSDKWQLKISVVHKCQTLHLGRSNKDISYTILDVVIPSVSTVKDLGITIDGLLDYSNHINAIVTPVRELVLFYAVLSLMTIV